MGSGDERGWSLWTELARLLTRPQRLVTIEVRGFVMIAAFLTSPLLLMMAPFVVPVLRDSLWLRWLAIIVSTMALLGFSGMLLTRTEQGFGLGLYFYLVAQLFNVIGLLLIRRRPLPEEEFSPD